MFLSNNLTRDLISNRTTMSETFEPDTGEMIVKRVSVPIGLEELMEGLAKEVLLKKPDDIYQFAAEYFSRLLSLREKDSYKVKTVRKVQSVTKQSFKPPTEKFLVRGAAKQLSRQLSVRGESPVKIVAPVRRPPVRAVKEDRGAERNKYADRRKARRSDIIDPKSKQVTATPKSKPYTSEDTLNTINKRDASLNNARRGRSTSRNAQSTPRQKSISTPRKADMSIENEKSTKTSGKADDKHKMEKKKEKPKVSQVPSIEENLDYIKNGKLAVTPPKIIKHPQVSETVGEISSLVVPQIVGHLNTSANDPNTIKEEITAGAVAKDESKISLEEKVNTLDSTDASSFNGEKETKKDMSSTNEDQQLSKKDTPEQKNQQIGNLNSVESFTDSSSSTHIKYNSDSFGNETSSTSELLDTEKSSGGCNLQSHEDPNKIIPSDIDKIGKDNEHIVHEDEKTMEKPSSLNENRDEIKTGRSSKGSKDVILDEHETTVSDHDSKDIQVTTKHSLNKNEMEEKTANINSKEKEFNHETASSKMDKNETGNTSDFRSIKGNEGIIAADILLSHNGMQKEKIEANHSKPDSKGSPLEKKSSSVIDKTKNTNTKDSESTKNNDSITVQEVPLRQNNIKEEQGVKASNIESKDASLEEFKSVITSTSLDTSKNSNTTDTESVKNKENIVQETPLTQNNKQQIGIATTKSNEHINKDEIKHEPVTNETEKTDNENIPTQEILSNRNEITSTDIDKKESSNINYVHLKDEGKSIEYILNKDGNDHKGELKVSQADSKGQSVITVADTKKIENNNAVDSETIGNVENNTDQNMNKVQIDQEKQELTTVDESNKTPNEEIKPMTNVSEEFVSDKLQELSTETNLKRTVEETNKKSSKDSLETDTKTASLTSEIHAKATDIQRDMTESQNDKDKELKARQTTDNSKEEFTPVIETTSGNLTETDVSTPKLSKLSDDLDGYKSKETDKKYFTEKDIKGNSKIISEIQNVSGSDIIIHSNNGKKQLITDESHKKSKEPLINVNNIIENVTDNVATEEKAKLLYDQDAYKSINESSAEKKLNENLKSVAEIQVVNEFLTKNKESIKDNLAGTELKKQASDLHIKDKIIDGNKEQIFNIGNEADSKSLDVSKNETPKHSESGIIIEGVIDKDESKESVKDNLTGIESKKHEHNLQIKEKIIADNHEQIINKGNDDDSKLFDKSKKETTKFSEREKVIEGENKDDKIGIDHDHNFKKNNFIDKNIDIENINKIEPNSGENKFTEYETDNAVISKSEVPSNMVKSGILSNISLDGVRGKNSDGAEKNTLNNYDQKDVESLGNKEDTVHPKDDDSCIDSISNSNSIGTTSNSDATDKGLTDTSISDTHHSSRNGIKSEIVKTNSKDLKNRENEVDEPGKSYPLSDTDIERNIYKPTIKSTEKTEDEETKMQLQDSDNPHEHIIKSVIEVAKSGSLDNSVKTYIGDFIQKEQDHVFIPKPDAAKGTGEIDLKDTQSSDSIADERKVAAGSLNNQNKTVEEHGKHNEITAQISDLQDSKSSMGKQFEIMDEHVNAIKLADKKPVKEEQQEEASATKHTIPDQNNMKRLINSITSIEQTGKMEDAAKNHINNFLLNEKTNVYSSQETNKRNDNILNAMEKEIVSNKKSVAQNYVNDSMRDTLNTNSSINIKTEKPKIDRKDGYKSASENKTNDKPKDFKGERQMRRIKTVDVIRNENNGKTQLRSRIPTADYRTRAKRDEGGKNFTRIKRSNSHNENIHLLVKDNAVGKTNISHPDTKDTEVAAVDNESAKNIAPNEEVPNGMDNKKYTKSSLGMSPQAIKNVETVTKIVPFKSSDKTHVMQDEKSSKEITSLKESSVDTSQSPQTGKNIETETKTVPFKSSDKSHVAQDEKSSKRITSLKEVVAAIKIQSIWRGYKVRSKRSTLKHKITLDNIDTDPFISAKSSDKRVSNAIEGGLTDQPIADLYCSGNREEKEEGLQKDKDNKFEKAVLIIQKLWRGFKVRQQMIKPHKSVEHDAQRDSDLKLHKTTNDTDNCSEKVVKAAITIQKIWRGFKVRKLRTNNEAINISTKSSNASASEEVKLRNGHTKEKEINVAKAQEYAGEMRFKTAALTIQKCWRGFKVRKILKRDSGYKTDSEPLIQDVDIKNKKKSETATGKEDIIQKNIISNLESNKSLELKHIKDEDQLHKAAITIQKIWRGFKVRKSIRNYSESKDENNVTDSSISINGKMRESSNDLSKEKLVCKEHLASQNSTESKSLKTQDEVIKAAVIIQTVWRSFKLRKSFKRNATSINNVTRTMNLNNGIELSRSNDSAGLKRLHNEDHFIKAAIMIQNIWRAFKVRNILQKQSKLQNQTKQIEMDGKTENEEKVNKEINESPRDLIKPSKKQSQNEDEAAVIIQKTWRGFKGRSLLKDSKKQIETQTKSVHGVSTKEEEKTIQLSKESKQQQNENFIKAAILIQKVWRGFKVRKYFKNKIGNQKLRDNVDKSGSTAEIPSTESDDKLLKAAIVIQKNWRGFKVREARQEKKLFGKPVENETSAIETVKEIDPKNKKSALKIQSLWRGYQVRKNINVIKNKLEDIDSKNDADKGRELTDGDILNAATKIQAGIRGYLQRKKYKDDNHKLNSISEEEDKYLTERDAMNKRELSEEEVLKALQDLDKIKVPNEIPVICETDKPTFYRSNTVQEPEIVTKHSSLLFETNPEDPSNVTNLTDADNNNNAPDKSEMLTPLEIEVKNTIDNIAGRDEHNVINGNNQLVHGLKTTSDLETYNNSKNDTEYFDVKQNLTNSMLQGKSQSDLSNITNQNNSNNNSRKDIFEQLVPDIDPYVPDENNGTASDRHEYERPLSMDSTDSAVTVIHRDISDKNNDDSLENKETHKITSDVPLMKDDNAEVLSEHETLINDFQNKLLDQISGKNGSNEDTADKFDIEKLRKELEEVGLIYNRDSNVHIRHENSREIYEDHDQLLDYLEGFQLSNEGGTETHNLQDSNSHFLSMDLPDIKEEDTESVPGRDMPDKSGNMAENNVNIEKIKTTLKECEEIASDINTSFQTTNSDDGNSDKPFTNHKDSSEKLDVGTNTASHPGQLFCGTTEEGQKENTNIPNDVEILKTLNIRDEPLETEGISEQNPNKDTDNKSISLNGLLHTGEFHDSVLPSSKVPSTANSHCVEKTTEELPLHDTPQNTDSPLLHTGELHDMVVVPLSLLSQDTDSSIKTTQQPNATCEFSMDKLLHTGELHDSLVVPLPLQNDQSFIENPYKSLESENGLGKSENSAKQDSALSSKLIHTGELHDSVVVHELEATSQGSAEEGTHIKTEVENNPRQVDGECQTSGDPSISVQLSEVPAGDEALTSPRPAPAVPDVSGVAGRRAQAPDKGALRSASRPDFSSPSQVMESEKRADTNDKTMEAEAATKIQAGFRGYQVRKQLKLKNGSSDITNQKRQSRRKSSGRLTETGRIPQNKPTDSKDIEEKSAVKIQAGIRGFLVRRRQKKQKNQES